MKKKLPTNTVDFMNSSKVRDYIFEKKKTDRIITFFGNNIKEFKRIYGEQNGMFTGERRSYYWIVDFKDKQIVIFSGSVRGSSYEVVCNEDINNFHSEDSYGDILVDFLKELEIKLKEIV